MQSLASYKKNSIKNRLHFKTKLKKLISNTFYFSSVISAGLCFNIPIFRNLGTDAPVQVNKWLYCLLWILEDQTENGRANETPFLTLLCLLKQSNTVPAVNTTPVFSPCLMEQHFISQDYTQLLLHIIPCRRRISLCFA